MNEKMNDNLDFLERISDNIHFLVRGNLPDGMILFFQIMVKVVLLILCFMLINMIVKFLMKFVFFSINKYSKTNFLTAIYSTKISDSLALFITIAIVKEMVFSIFYRHPKSYTFFNTVFELIFVFAFISIFFRILNAINYYCSINGNVYKITGIKAITQSLKIIGSILFVFVGISVLFQISFPTIFKGLGAMTAFILLIFRDTILGFITGIHVSTSKNIKVGDWISIPKYHIEGYINDIGLLTTKISNFDKTISTIPTYDLLSTEIKNNQIMSESNTRRIKKSILFDIKSFHFLDEQMFEEFLKIDLVRDYLLEKKNQIASNHSEKENLSPLTNIGVFRIYAQNYLKSNPNIVQNLQIIVRQLEMTDKGIPLEIYCFSNNSIWEQYEQIQSTILEHLLIVSKKFELEIK